MDIVALKHLYIEQAKELYAHILSGKDWREVQQHKQLVTELSIVLDKRLNRNGHSLHPAENRLRKEG